MAQEELKQDWNALKREIQKSIESLERGEGIAAETVFSELKNRYQRRKDARSLD